MKWSRYAIMFKSKNHDFLLYSLASNSFLQVDQSTAMIIKEIRENLDGFDFSRFFGLFYQLKKNGFLVDDDHDDNFLNIIRMRRLDIHFSNNILSLTIAVTNDCNFACPYCFEKNKDKSVLTDDVADNLLKFIKKQPNIKALDLTWFGGEPLLVFDRIKKINAKIKSLQMNYTSGIITNGYLLNSKMISEFNDLNIRSIQITIDGDQKTHDRRRFLVGGKGTFQKIVDNIDLLVNSNWKGKVNLRVNVDATNMDQYSKVYRFFIERYSKEQLKKIHIYSGFTDDNDNPEPNSNCFDSDQKGKFIVDLAKNEKIISSAIFPHLQYGGCCLTHKNSYVIGTQGEIYKCWNDIGRKDRIIGNVKSNEPWNMALLAEGMISGNYLHDPDCIACTLFPICNGCCSQARMLNKRDHGKRDPCSYFKDHLSELLEIYYENKIIHSSA